MQKKRENAKFALKKITAVIMLCFVVFCAAFGFATVFGFGMGGGFSAEPVAVSAASGNGTESNPYIMKSVDDWKTVIDRPSSAADPTYVTLGANITASGSFAISGVTSSVAASIYNGALNVPAGKYVVLDLKNYKIDRGLASTTGVSYGHVLYVSGNLTINGVSFKAPSDNDSTTKFSADEIKGGAITGGFTSGGAGGGGIHIPVGGTVTMNGGNIYNCYNTYIGDVVAGGGGVYVRGTFIMNGGYIHDCHSTGANGNGGGVSVGAASSTASTGCGTFIMNGGAIFDCRADNYGSGVDVSSPGSKFIMYGGELYANYNGAVGCFYGSNFTMNGGWIHDHLGAQLFCNGLFNAYINLNGGVISDNYFTTFLGSKWANYSLLYIGGAVQITGNYTYGSYGSTTKTEQNLTPGTTTIPITGDLSTYVNAAGQRVGGQMARIGITVTSARTFTSNYGSYNSNTSASKYFYSDNAGYYFTDTDATLSTSNQAKSVTGTQTIDGTIVWKYKYEGDTAWRTTSDAMENDDFVDYAGDSYLTVTNPTKAMYIAAFDSNGTQISDSDLFKTISSGSTDYSQCSPSILGYETGYFGFRYNGAKNYQNSTFTFRMNIVDVHVNVETFDVEYTGQYQNGIYFDVRYLTHSDYFTYTVTSPSGAKDVIENENYLQFLSTGTYKINLKLKDEYADLINANVIGWAAFEHTTESDGSITITFTVERSTLAVPEDEQTTYTVYTSDSGWTLEKFVDAAKKGEADEDVFAWFTGYTAAQKSIISYSVDYKSFASTSTYEDFTGSTLNPGYYKITLTLDDTQNYRWSDKTDGEKTFTFTVNKASIVMNSPKVDEYGNSTAIISAKSGVFPSDIAAMNGAYGLEYIAKGDVGDDTKWFRTLPANAGEYYARPYILDPENCNYEINYEITNNVGSCYTLFTRLKDSIAVPYLYTDNVNAVINSTTYTTTIPYTGEEQILTLVNKVSSGGIYTLTDGIVVAASELAPVSEVEFSASGMDTYTITVRLADPDNTRWATGAEDDTADKTVTLIISKAYLQMTLEYDDGTDFASADPVFEKGQRSQLTLSVGKILSVAGAGASNVSIDVRYAIAGGASGEIATTNMKIEDDYLYVDIDLLTLPVGKYTFTVKLTNGVSANDNYTLVEDNDGIYEAKDLLSFAFEILKAEINIASVDWQYSNSLSTHGAQEAVLDGVAPELFYNGYLYEFTVAKLYDANGNRITNTAGIEFTYQVTDSRGIPTADYLNAGTYTTTVSFSVKEGVEGYTLTASPISITWEIKAVNFDLKDLKFSPNATFDWDYHEVFVTNAEIAALSEPMSGAYVNKEVWAGNYKAGFVVYSDASGNLTYYCSLEADAEGKYHLDNGAVVWLEGGDAYIEWDWMIAKAQITIGNAATYWKEDVITDINGAQFTSYLPKVYDDYVGVLDIRYYSDANCTQEVDIRDIIVKYELKVLETYYVKVTIGDEAADNYELLPNGYATKSFTVGSTKKGLTVNVSLQGENGGLVEGSTNEFASTYSDKGYTLTATASGFASSGFTVTYYQLDDNGEWTAISGVPTEVGQYKMTVSFAKPNAVYEIKNPDYYLTIYEEGDPEFPEITDPDTPEDPTPDNPDDPDELGTPDENGGIFKPTLNEDITFSGEEISILDYLVGFNSKYMTISGDTVGLKAGTYLVTITLIYPDTYWKEAISATAKLLGFAVSLADDDVSFDLEWKINSYSIPVSSWTAVAGEVPQLDGVSEGILACLDFTYTDENGEEVDPETLEVGTNYFVTATVKDEYVGSVYFENESGERGISSTYGFTFTKANSWTDFFTKKFLGIPVWAWLLILLVALLLIFLIVFLVKRRKKENEEEAETPKPDSKLAELEARLRTAEARSVQNAAVNAGVAGQPVQPVININTAQPAQPVVAATANAAQPTQPVVAAAANATQPAQPVVAAAANATQPAQPAVAAAANAAQPAQPAVAATANAAQPAQPIVVQPMQPKVIMPQPAATQPVVVSAANAAQPAQPVVMSAPQQPGALPPVVVLRDKPKAAVIPQYGENGSMHYYGPSQFGPTGVPNDVQSLMDELAKARAENYTVKAMAEVEIAKLKAINEIEKAKAEAFSQHASRGYELPYMQPQYVPVPQYISSPPATPAQNGQGMDADALGAVMASMLRNMKNNDEPASTPPPATAYVPVHPVQSGVPVSGSVPTYPPATGYVSAPVHPVQGNVPVSGNYVPPDAVLTTTTTTTVDTTKGKKPVIRRRSDYYDDGRDNFGGNK